MSKPELVRWQNECSDSDELYFNKLIDVGRPVFSVTDNGKVFDFIFEEIGPYRVIDEAFLTYDPIVGETSWTCIVNNSVWAQEFSVILEGIYFTDGLVHYIILTYDACFEALAPKPPRIEVRNLEIAVK